MKYNVIDNICEDVDLREIINKKIFNIIKLMEYSFYE